MTRTGSKISHDLVMGSVGSSGEGLLREVALAGDFERFGGARWRRKDGDIFQRAPFIDLGMRPWLLVAGEEGGKKKEGDWPGDDDRRSAAAAQMACRRMLNRGGGDANTSGPIAVHV